MFDSQENNRNYTQNVKNFFKWWSKIDRKIHERYNRIYKRWTNIWKSRGDSYVSKCRKGHS